MPNIILVNRADCQICFVRIIFLPPATKLGQGYVFTRVCDSVLGGGSASVHAGIPLPQADTPPEADPPGPGTPREQCMLGDTGNKWAVRILLECILVSNCFYTKKFQWTEGKD